MRKHIAAILILSGTTTVCTIAAFQHTSATVNDKVYALTNGAIAAAVLMSALAAGIAATIKKRPAIRNYAIATALASVLVASIPIAGTSRRLTSTKRYLSQTYALLAENGPPFPNHMPVHQNPELMISHGYWVAPDRQSFEVYYHHGSDSFTMAFPVATWEWRGNKYAGPQPE